MVMRQGPRRSVRLKLVAAVSMVATLAVVALTGVQALFEYEQLRERAISRNQLVAQLLAMQVQNFVTNTHEQLAGLVADPDFIDDVLSGDAAALSPRLAAIAPTDPDLLVLAVLDRGGAVWASSGTGGAIGQSLMGEQHVQDALIRGAPGLGPPRLSLVNRIPVAPLAVPIRAGDGKIIGALAAPLSLERLSAEMNAVRIGNRGYANLVWRDGTILTHPDPERLLTPASPTDETLARALRGQASSLETVDPTLGAVFAATAPVPAVGWVRVRIPAAEVLAPLYQWQLRAAAVALLTLLVAVIVGSVMAQGLTAPIRALQAATKQMERGEYRPGSLSIGSGDELEELGRDFDTMAARLQESETRYRAVSELTSDFAYAYSVLPDGRPVGEWATEACTRMTGFTPDEIATKGGWLGLIHPEDQEIAQKRQQQLRSGLPDVSELRIVTKSGATRTLRIHARPVWDEEQRRTVRVYGAARDITEQKRLEAEHKTLEGQLQRVEKLRSLGVLAGGVAHQMNNILAAILGQADILRPDVTDPALRRRLESITRAAEDGAAAVRRIQQFARDGASLSLAPVELAGLARDVAEATAPRWRDQAQQEGRVIELTVEATQPVWVTGVASDLREALMNLVLNAVDALPSGGSIGLEVSEADGRAAVRVVDTGVGIPADVLERVYDPFFTTKPLGAGSGLGLAITHGIVQRHRGTIDIASSPHGGTTVEIRLPAIAAPEPAEPEPEQPTAPPRRVLIVDDEPVLVEQLRAILNLDGHEVRACSSGDEAIAVLRNERFDVVITDLGMPGANGWDVAREAKERLPNVHVGLITGWAGELDDGETLRERGADFVIAKPYRITAIREAMAAPIPER